MRLLSFLIATGLLLTGAPKLNRNTVVAMEKSFDRRLEREVLDGDALLLIGMTRGVQVEGFGVIYSTEIDLVATPGISPFHPEFTKEDVARLRQRKLARLPALRKAMRQMLLDTAGSLDGLPPEERLVVGVTLNHRSFENITGIPSQIVMQSEKRTLLDFATGKRDRAQMESAIRTQEY